MMCKLCLRADNIAFRLSSAEGIQENVQLILHKHFNFCFNAKGSDDSNEAVCFSCWPRVKEFHEFYSKIEELHDVWTEAFNPCADVAAILETKLEDGASNECIPTSRKNNVKLVASGALHTHKFRIEPGEEPKRKRGRPRKDNQTTNQSIGNAASICIIPKVGLKAEPQSDSDGQVTVENRSYISKSVKSNPNTTAEVSGEPKKRRGRPRKLPAENTSIGGPLQLVPVIIPLSKVDLKAEEQSDDDYQDNVENEDNVSNFTSHTERQLGEDQPNGHEHPKANEAIDIKPQEISVQWPDSDGSMTEHEPVVQSDDVSDHYYGFDDMLSSNIGKKPKMKKPKIKKPKRKPVGAITLKKLAERRATKASPHRCEICQIWLPNWRNFYRHNKTTHLQLEHRCTALRCIESYATQEELQQHISERHAKQKCPLCLAQVRDVEKHHKQMHEVQMLICELCGFTTRASFEFEAHYESRHSNHVYECDICGHQCKSKFLIKIHMRKRHKNTDQAQQCNICGRMLKNKSTLNRHQIVHNPEAKTRYKCTYCSRGFPNKYRLKEHTATHSLDRALRCTLCDETFRFSSHLSVHRKNKHPQLYAATPLNTSGVNLQASSSMPSYFNG